MTSTSEFFFKTWLIPTFLLLTLSNCSSPTSSEEVKAFSLPIQKDVIVSEKLASSPNISTSLWSDDFSESNWKEHWGMRSPGSWGLQNTEVMTDPSGKFSQVLRVRYPAGSASPTVSRTDEKPLGGAQFDADLGISPSDSLRLSYSVRFSNNFDFVKGGKLPGLFGGSLNSGGKIPDGTNGFSTRYMWRKNGDGEVYAYLPSSEEHGTSLGRGNWRFQPGNWHHLEQEVVLNQPGQRDGQIRVWFDGEKVLDESGLTFRTTEDLKIEGIFFSTFFGGGDPSWATPKDVYVDFANFSVAPVN